MKKFYKVLLMSCFIFILSFAAVKVQAQTQAAETSKMNIKLPEIEYYLTFDTMEQIEEESDIIVKGKILSSTNVLTSDTPGYTLSKVEITESFSGAYTIGDAVEIVEPYFIYIDGIGETFMVQMEGYMPSEIEKEYIFLLHQYRGIRSELIGKYEMFNCILGRYPVPATSGMQSRSKMIGSIPSNEDLGINEQIDTTTYRDIYNDVLSKYNK